MQFSQKLIQQLIAYFIKNYGLEISEEQAEVYLDSLSDLYLMLNRENDKKMTLKRASARSHFLALPLT